MSLIDQNTLATDQTFQNRVKMAAIKTALNVMNESSEVQNHEARFNYAVQVIAGTIPYLVKLSYLVVTNSTIAATAPTGDNASDGDIEFVVSSFWDTLRLG